MNQQERDDLRRMRAINHEHKGFSEEKCERCGWVMGHPPLNCNNDNTPHRFPSQNEQTMNKQERDALREKHQPQDFCNDCDPRCKVRCRECDGIYPCDVIKVLDAWEEVMPTDATSNTTTAEPSQKSNEAVIKSPYIDIEFPDWCYDCETYLSNCTAIND